MNWYHCKNELKFYLIFICILYIETYIIYNLFIFDFYSIKEVKLGYRIYMNI